MSRRSRPAAHEKGRYASRYAAILAVLAVAAATVILMACPPSAKPAGVQDAVPQQNPSTQETPRQWPETQTAPQESTQPVRPETRDTREQRAASERMPSLPPEHPQREKQGMLAIIIDDAGYDMDALQAFLDLPIPLTVAVLPNLPHSAEAARRVRAAGKTLILHCPMEPEGGENPGPGALYTGQSPKEIGTLLDAMFASVPGAVGMNNHMGSKATADPVLMGTVLGYLRERGLLYIDSRTTAETVGPAMARQAGVRSLQRDVFIDVGTGAEEIASAFAAGISKARARGSAVLIGHVQNKGVVAILRSMNGRLEKQGARIARLEEVMSDREGKAGW